MGSKTLTTFDFNCTDCTQSHLCKNLLIKNIKILIKITWKYCSFLSVPVREWKKIVCVARLAFPPSLTFKPHPVRLMLWKTKKKHNLIRFSKNVVITKTCTTINYTLVFILALTKWKQWKQLVKYKNSQFYSVEEREHLV